MSVGIVAFGSIVDEPGPELEAVTVRRVSVQTPFAVEFARSSRTRDGGPTLVPVNEGGAAVGAVVLVLDDSIGETKARWLLYRRETRRTSESEGSGPPPVGWIAAVERFGGVETCIYTALPANIDPLTVARLAQLAVDSAVARAGATRRDGISYLEQQKERGLSTPLMPGYEVAILARTDARDLSEAWAKGRSPKVP
jgi:hypothetical protein